jgi:hypothetical protein
LRLQSRRCFRLICITACVVNVVLLLLLQPALAQAPPEKPVNATLNGTGSGRFIYWHNVTGYRFAGIFKINVSGTIYDAYCIDMYTSINISDVVGVNGALSNENQSVNWQAVNYILYTYNYSTAPSKSNESAAIQAAIWYFTSEPYGNYTEPGSKYQFMTDPTDGSGYDAYSEDFGSAIRDRAFEIINDTKDNWLDFHFPTRIELSSSQLIVPPGQTATVTATVYNETNSTLTNITIKFGITEGDGTLDGYSGITNETGKAVTNFTAGTVDTTVVAWIEGNYGTLLYGTYILPAVQNITTVTTIPRSIEHLITLPIPELPTVALMGTGLLALIGYVSYRRTKKSF